MHRKLAAQAGIMLVTHPRAIYSVSVGEKCGVFSQLMNCLKSGPTSAV